METHSSLRFSVSLRRIFNLTCDCRSDDYCFVHGAQAELRSAVSKIRAPALEMTSSSSPLAEIPTPTPQTISWGMNFFIAIRYQIKLMWLVILLANRPTVLQISQGLKFD